MKVSELITLLQTAQAECGNFTVYAVDDNLVNWSVEGCYYNNRLDAIKLDITHPEPINERES